MRIHSEHYKLSSRKNIFLISSPIGKHVQSFLLAFSHSNCRTDNLTEQLITCLRKGNESDGKLAAIVTSLFFIQLGQPDDDLFLKFRDALLPTLRDETKSPSIRKKVGQSIPSSHSSSSSSSSMLIRSV